MLELEKISLFINPYYFYSREIIFGNNKQREDDIAKVALKIKSRFETNVPSLVKHVLQLLTYHILYFKLMVKY